VSHVSNRHVGEGGLSFFGVLCGWVFAEVVGFVIGFVVGLNRENISPDQARMILLYCSLPIGALVGGLVAGVIAKRNLFFHGFLVGILCVVGAVIVPCVLSQGKIGLEEAISQAIRQKEVLISWALVVLGGIFGAVMVPES